jgi:hypothetical protein
VIWGAFNFKKKKKNGRLGGECVKRRCLSYKWMGALKELEEFIAKQR